MPKTFVCDFEPGVAVAELFVVRDKQLRAARNATLYIELELADKTGTLPGRFWQATQDIFDSFEVDDFVEVKGVLETYKSQLQLNATSIVRRDPATVSLGDFLPTSEQDLEALLEEIRSLVSSIERPELRLLLDVFFTDEAFCQAFARSPAAVSYHHAYLGGLLEHTVAVARLVVPVTEQYPRLDRDLLLAGALLHDIGKIDEFTPSPSFRYTDSGQLLGHILLGVLRLEEAVAQVPDFPPTLRDLLRHILLSHHGEYEWGSPKLPMTAEALALHFLDNLDAKTNAFLALTQADSDSAATWTQWSRLFQRRLYKGPLDSPAG